MQFLTKTKIDFMKYRGIFVWVSLALVAIATAELTVNGVNLGIDFAGGTQLTVKMREPVVVDDLRRVFEDAGLREAQIQRFGDAENHEVLIKAPVLGDSEEGSGKQLIEALDGDLNAGQSGTFDLNQRGSEALSTLLLQADPDAQRELDEDAAAAYYDDLASDVISAREKSGIFADWETVTAVDGLSAEGLATLQEQTFLGAFHVIQNENVGSVIGSELRTKGILAVVLSLIGMLFYIWVRFELRFGIGALVAVFHDFLIVFGLYALLNYEFNLSTIAAFLTLVGYSVNDTVVIFDRVRENMARYRRRPLKEVMNLSLNQTLSRTLLTSGTTLLTVGCLFFFGGEVIRGFAFVLLIGVVVGTYSSIFVASPFALLWERLFGRDAKERRRAGQKKQIQRTA